MSENEIGGVADCGIKVQMRLGPGPLESVYEAVLFSESGEALMKGGISHIVNGKVG